MIVNGLVVGLKSIIDMLHENPFYPIMFTVGNNSLTIIVNEIKEHTL